MKSGGKQAEAATAFASGQSATGFQTFGDDYAVDKPSMEITVKMKRPAGQYSIYEDHPDEKKNDPEPQKQPDKDAKEKPQ